MTTNDTANEKAANASNDFFIYPGSSATPRDGSACAAIIRRGGDNAAQETAQSLPQGVTAPAAHLRGIAIGLAAIDASDAKGARVFIVEPSPWVRDIAAALSETLDEFGGRKADGAKLANAEGWRALREAAKRLGGLACDGGPVEFIAPQDGADERRLKAAKGVAREALTQKKAA